MLGRRLSRSKLNQRRYDGSIINPMDGLGNLADAMLVLAVGIMLALVIHWNIDVEGQHKEGNIGPGASGKLEGVEKVDSGNAVDLDQLEELGKGHLGRHTNQSKYYEQR
jgi:hypothetical protein